MLKTLFSLFHSINPFSTNVPLTNKPGGWFLLAKYLKNTLWNGDILSKDVGHRRASLLKLSLSHKCFSNLLIVKITYLVST